MKESRMIARELKYQYLSDCGSRGGYKREYMAFAEKWIEENPDEVLRLGAETFLDTFSEQWSPKLSRKIPNPTQGDLLINEKPCPHELRYEEPDVPGGWVTVLAYYATFGQWRRALDAKQGKIAESSAEYESEYDLFASGLDRVDGDESRRIYEASDNPTAA